MSNSLNNLGVLCVLAVQSAFALSADHSRPSATTTPTFATRRIQPNNPLHLRHFSAVERATRRHKLSIQRLARVFPPVISAD